MAVGSGTVPNCPGKAPRSSTCRPVGICGARPTCRVTTPIPFHRGDCVRFRSCVRRDSNPRPPGSCRALYPLSYVRDVVASWNPVHRFAGSTPRHLLTTLAEVVTYTSRASRDSNPISVTRPTVCYPWVVSRAPPCLAPAARGGAVEFKTTSVATPRCHSPKEVTDVRRTDRSWCQVGVRTPYQTHPPGE